ncbi:GNAT family N-acetyltransferase [Rhodococcus sp. NPDC076796]|uniref:GNAT family N-acetyltransferase n=1 Tax=Rhodococcus sp. NPDC076796 TaxID=3154859 RepID=UPI00344EA99E
MVYRIYTARPNDIDRCAHVLAEAFCDDPLMVGIWPRERARHTALPSYFATSLRHFHLSGGGVRYASTEAGEVSAVSVWDGPSLWKPPTATTLRALPGLVAALRARTAMALRIRAILDAHHPVARHWYLANVGSATAHRGLGAAKELIADKLAQCDENSLAAYLVCTDPANVTYYEKFGFTVSERFSLPNGSNLASMWRSPR